MTGDVVNFGGDLFTMVTQKETSGTNTADFVRIGLDNTCRRSAWIGLDNTCRRSAWIGLDNTCRRSAWIGLDNSCRRSAWIGLQRGRVNNKILTLIFQLILKLNIKVNNILVNKILLTLGINNKIRGIKQNYFLNESEIFLKIYFSSFFKIFNLNRMNTIINVQFNDKIVRYDIIAICTNCALCHCCHLYKLCVMTLLPSV